MGVVFSSFRKPEETDYEKILSNLDSEIKKAELRLSEIKVRERRVVLIWLLYTTLAYALYLVAFFLYFSQDEDLWDNWVTKVLPIPLTPLAIFMVNRLFGVFFKRKQTYEETQLGDLRTQQKLKIEELKKKTSYYTTKSLVERYDPSATPRQGRGSQGQGQPGQGQGQGQGQRPNQPQQQKGGPPMPGQQLPAMQRMPDGTLVRVPINPANLPQRAPQPGAPHPFAPSQFPQQQPGSNGAVAMPNPMLGQYPNSGPMVPTERYWYEKLVDLIVGEDGSETKYALICNQCFAHNGLVLPQEVDDIQYVCPKCNHFNPSRRSRQLTGIPHINEPNSQPGSQASSRRPSQDTGHSPAPHGRDSSAHRGRSLTPRGLSGEEQRSRSSSTTSRIGKLGEELVDGTAHNDPAGVVDGFRIQTPDSAAVEADEEDTEEGTEDDGSLVAEGEEGSIAGRVRRRRNPRSE